MAIPAIPSNFNVQQGNGETFLSWNIVAGATSYSVQISTDGVTYSLLSLPTTNYYLDSAVTVGTLYYYKVASVNASGTSGFCAAKSIVPTLTGDLSLGQMREMSKQRADMVNSNFVSMPEWNTYINQSYFELYDLLTTVYEDYFIQTPYIFQTDGSAQYTLPDDFYKLLGVDCGLANNINAWGTLKKFPFAKRNEYVYPQISTTLLGIYDLRYRVMGNTLYFIPTPSAGQYIRVWYVPKMTQLLQDTDILTGISGWSEYVIVDAAIKAKQKQDDDISVLGQQKMMLIKRIEESAANRDQGMADTIADTRSNIDSINGSPWNGSFAGY